MVRFATLIALLLSLAAPVWADGRVTLGFGRLFTNDQVGDGHDRWRTGSYAISVVSGPVWNGTLPSGFGQIIELRFRSAIIAPADLTGDGTNDRPYVGALSYGIHTHMAVLGGAASVGIDLTMTGPQTGLADFQDWFHSNIASPRLSDAVVDGQIGNGLYPSLTAEYAYPWRVSDRLMLRPFVEVQSGVEDIARIGGDLVWGVIVQRDLLIRDHPTGQLYRGTHAPDKGFSVVAGADWAQVGDSVYLPASSDVISEETRTRARIGIHWQPRPNTSLFYGVTWLSPEFLDQPEGQVLGSVSLKILF